MIDFPCVCGHPKSEHDMTVILINDDNYCNACSLIGGRDLRGMSLCFHKYKPDNLKYLEQLNERS